MKKILLSSAFSIALLTTGCNTDSTKEAGSDSSKKSAPLPSRFGRY